MDNDTFLRGFRMMVIRIFCLFILSLCFFFQTANGNESIGIGHPGLLIIAHGAPGPQWNEPVNSLIGRIRELNESKKTFHAVEGAFLEFAQPDVASGVEKLEAAGCSRIIVVPFFIAPSSHSHFDIPAVLGLYSSPDIRRVLEEEGAHVAKPRIPVTLTQTIGEGELLDQFACDQVRELSKDPKNEAIVLIAHGCPDHHRLVETITRRVATYCCGQTGIDYGDWAYCEVGQGFWEEAAPVIARAAEHKENVLVVGLYISSSAERIYTRATKSSQGPEFKNPLEGMMISFSGKGIVDLPATADWLFQTAASTLKP